MKHDVYDTGAAATSSVRTKGSPGRTSAAADAETQERMRRMEAAGEPGAGHKAMDHFVGQWQCDVKCWMDPNGEPEQSNATATVNWIMGGRFIQEEFHGKMMSKEFHGRTLMGFNNIKQTYQSMWVDDMNTAMFTCEGRGDEKAITLEGKSSCAATGRTDLPMRLVYRKLSADKHVFEIHDGSKGYAKTLEITYTRQ